MLHARQYMSPAIGSLIEHLDAARSACDALLETQAAAADPHEVLRLELTAIAHVLQGREDMQSLHSIGGAVASQIALFLTVTCCLEEPTPASATPGLDGSATRLIGGRIAAATLGALATATRDVVELCFYTFDDCGEGTGYLQTPALTEGSIWVTGPGCT